MHFANNTVNSVPLEYPGKQRPSFCSIFCNEELFCLAAAFDCDSIGKAPVDLPHPDINQYRCISFSKSHGILQFIDHTRAEECGLNHLADRSSQAKANLPHLHFKQIAEFKYLSSLLRKHNLEFLLVKGRDLSFRYYEKPHERPSIDIDLIVRQTQLPVIFKLLQDNGFRIKNSNRSRSDSQTISFHAAIYGQAFHVTKGDMEIDLHPTSKTKFERYFATRLCRSIEGNDYLALSDIENIKFLLIHGAKHRWSKIIWFYDFHLAFQACSAEQLEEIYWLLSKSGFRRSIKIVLFFCQELFNQKLSPALQRDIFANRNDHSLFMRVGLQLSNSCQSRRRIVSDMITRLLIEERFSNKLTVIVSRCLIPTINDFSWILLPRSLTALYLLVRPCRLFYGLATRLKTAIMTVLTAA